MPSTVLMPALSPTMTQGYLVKWHKAVGDPIRSGDVLMEVETDKAVMEVEATQEGILDHVLIQASPDTMVQVGQVLAIVRSPQEPEGIGLSHPAVQAGGNPDKDSGQSQIATKSDSGGSKASDGGGSKASDSGGSKASNAAPEPQQRQADSYRGENPGHLSGSVASPLSGAFNPASGRILASPLAKKIAGQQGINLQGLRGTGPGGRIVKRDLDRVLESAGEAQSPEPSTLPPQNPLPHNQNSSPASSKAAPGKAAGSIPAILWTSQESPGPAPTQLPLTAMRRVIAQRLTQSKQEVPHFTLTVDCRMDDLGALRERMNQPEKRFSINDFLVRACALALWDTPAMRTLWGGDHLIQHTSVDLAVAVAVPGGLITPIIQQAERKPLSVVAQEMKSLAQRARAGELRPQEYQGGTFTLSNLGMHGIDSFTPIINQPQSGILAIGATRLQPCVNDQGEIIAGQVLRASVAADHRSVDGQDAATFLTRFRFYVENPYLLLC